MQSLLLIPLSLSPALIPLLLQSLAQLNLNFFNKIPHSAHKVYLECRKYLAGHISTIYVPELYTVPQL